jgi:Bacterial pre-peptidase C-terminal domain
LNKRDRKDFYSFTLNRSSTVNLQLSRLRSNADLMLMNGAGQTVMRSSKGGKQAEQISGNMEAGTYYIQVLGRGGKTTPYKLSASATVIPVKDPPLIPPPPPTEGTLNNPINLGTLTSGNVTKPGKSVPSSGASTYYKFQLQDISATNITLSNVSGSTTYATLYYDFNKNGLPDNDEVLKSGSGSSSGSTPISGAFPTTGTYFLKVGGETSSQGSTYDLVVSTTPVAGTLLPAEPGSDALTAYNLGTLDRGGRIEFRDYLGQIDSTDVYRFNISQTSTVNFAFKTLTPPDYIGSLALYYDANKNGLIDTSEQVYASPTLSAGSLNAQAGDYFIRFGATNVDNVAYWMIMTANP